MKNFYLPLLLFSFLLLGVNNLRAEKIVEEVEAFLKSQPQTVTAYDIEQHFKLMTDPVFGTLSTVSGSSSSFLGVTALDATHFVIVYTHPTDSEIKAVVGEINNLNVSSYGAPVTIKNYCCFYLEVSTINASKFVVAYTE